MCDGRTPAGAEESSSEPEPDVDSELLELAFDSRRVPDPPAGE